MPRSALSYRDLLSRNVRAARAAADLSQADVAARMQDLGFKEWRRQTVAKVERGNRRLLAEELPGLMVTLETDMTALVYPAAEFQALSLPDGREFMLPAAKYGYDPDRESMWDGNISKLPQHPSQEQG